MRERGPAHTRCAHELSGSEEAIAAYVATREPGEEDWYLRHDSGLSPYQQRQLAELTTGSEYAACRGKRGTPEDTLCKCGMRKRETVAHVLLECSLYTQQRQAVRAAMRAHISAIAQEHGYPLTEAEALEWVISNQSPGWVLDSASTVAGVSALRGAVLDMHREVRKARYSASKAVPADRRVSEL